MVTNTEVRSEAATVVWAAGVSGASINGLDADALMDSGNRLKVNNINQDPGYREIFAIGDIAHMVTDDSQWTSHDGATGHVVRPSS